MIVAAPLVLYFALACATVKPPPGAPVAAPTAAGKALPPHVSTRPAWDVLGVCTALNQGGVQSHPSLNPN